MKRVRAVAILIKGNEILLMYRKKEKEYFVFPGGGVEKGETIEEAVLREMKEETTLKIRINKLLYHHIYDDGSEQYFYLCNYVKGRPKLSKESIEYKRVLKKIDFYNPLWVKIKKLKDMLVYIRNQRFCYGRF